ncbi:sulfotransferase family protein [Pseudofrankia sp. EUN1h]|uniref:sulfotransferase family protein n=2 Tax=Pseudofrankia TaxID=2994363 RepID=UPI0003106454|nr:sulfotransferase [Pseudofrankia sp. EUN1h]
MREDNRDPAERARLEAAEREPLDMTVDAVLTAARTRTSLDDFGLMDFTERLARLLAEVGADENVWKAHKATFVEHCVGAAANRLLIQRYWTAHPDCLGAPIVRPINVVALPRSGSTHLENLVGADRRLRHLPVYLAAQPAPRPDEPSGHGAGVVDPRWTRSQARWERASQNEFFAAMHEHSPDHACGENELQLLDFASYQWEWLARVPGWRDYYLTRDQTPHYLYMRDVLKAIAWQLPAEQRELRWMLKSNQHSEQLGPLLAAYPDVTVVMIHRDPVATLQSLLTMRGLALKMSQRRPDINAHVDYWVNRLELMLRRYLRDRHLVPPEQLVEVRFDDIVGNDVEAAAGVLERAGLAATGESIADIEAYLAKHPRGRRGRVVYDLEGDFGLDAGRLRDRFAFYIDAVGLRPEAEKGRGR